MSDKNILIKVDNDYSEDEAFIRLIQKYYSQEELAIATDRLNKIIYPMVEKEVTKYQNEINEQFLKYQSDSHKKVRRAFFIAALGIIVGISGIIINFL